MQRVAWIGLFFGGFAWRLWLLLDRPVVYAWDAFMRVWERDTLFASHWLPVPQLPLVLSGDSVIAMRSAYALSGAAAAVALGVAVARIADRRTGLAFGWLLALQPTFVKWTINPYQEGFFLAFLGLALIAWPRGLDDEARGKVPWLGAAALAVAALCRYEAWGVAAILAGGALIRRRARALRYLIPTAAAIALWVASAPWRSPRLGGGPFPAPRLLRSDAATVLDALAEATPSVAAETVADLTWLALPLVAWGAVVAWRRGGVARELMIALAMFTGIAVLRRANHAAMTDRMVILPVAFGLLAAAFGLTDLVDRLASKLSRGARTAILAGATAVLLALFAAKGRGDVARAAAVYAPEAALARELETLPTDAVVWIEARELHSRRTLSMITAVFANSLRLDHDAPRWIYAGKPGPPPSAPPDYRVYWDGEAYAITAARAAPSE